MAEEIIVRKIVVEVDGAVYSLNELDDAAQSATKSTESLDDTLDSMPGPIGKASGALKKFRKVLTTISKHPIILIISLIVLAVVALGKAFSKTQEGADKIRLAMDKINAVVDVLISRMAKLFKALGKIFKGEFKEGFADMKESVSGVGEEIKEATVAVEKFHGATIALEEATIANTVANAEAEKQIAALRLQTQDLTLTTEERLIALQKAASIEKRMLQDNLDLQAEALRLAEQDLANTPENLRTREQLAAVAEEEVKLLGLQTSSLTRQKELQAEINTLVKEGNAEAEKAVADAKAEEERLKDSLEKYKRSQNQKTHEGQLANLQELYDKDLILKEEFDLRKQDLETAHQEALDKIKQDAADDEKDRMTKEAADKLEAAQTQEQQERHLQDIKVGIWQDTASAITAIAGENSKVSKAIAIAEATRSAITGAMHTYEALAKIPYIGPVVGAVAAAAQLAAGLANVKKLIAVPDPSAPGGTAPNVSLARPGTGFESSLLNTGISPLPQDVNIVQGSTTSRGGLKAYVVQSDVTAAQDMERRQRESITL